MVIFAPIDQFGCFSASSGRTCSSSSCVRPKNGPPEHVRIRRRTSFSSRQPCRLWKMALCSESTGTISAPQRAASAITSSPAQTSVSLFASAMRFFCAMAASVGSRPTLPLTAVTTVSACGSCAASSRPSGPSATRTSGRSRSRSRSTRAASQSYSTASSGRNSRTCCSSRSTCRFAVSAATPSPSSRATCSVCRPMEPVAPRSEITFVMSFSFTAAPCKRSSRSSARRTARCQTGRARRRDPAAGGRSP